jgi:hypothetical protein
MEELETASLQSGMVSLHSASHSTAASASGTSRTNGCTVEIYHIWDLYPILSDVNDVFAASPVGRGAAASVQGSWQGGAAGQSGSSLHTATTARGSGHSGGSVKGTAHASSHSTVATASHSAGSAMVLAAGEAGRRSSSAGGASGEPVVRSPQEFHFNRPRKGCRARRVHQMDTSKAMLTAGRSGGCEARHMCPVGPSNAPRAALRERDRGFKYILRIVDA